MWRTLLALGMCCLATLAAADAVVAEVNGVPVTLRQLEDELLKREGTDQLVELVEERLKGARWSAIDDDQVVVAVPGGVVRRIDIALRSLEEHGAKVRNELVTMLATRQAIAHANIVLDRALVDAEVAREQRRFSRRLERAGRPAMPFEQAILAKEGISIREWRRSDAVRLAAGLHELVLRRIQPEIEAIREHYAKYPERFEQREAIQLQVIFIPFKTITLRGREMIDPQHQRSLRKVMGEIYHNILQQRQSFAEAWSIWGAGYDQLAEDGLVGWVDRAGNTSMPGVQAIPSNVRDIAFAANLDNGAKLLEPIVSDDGIRLVKVLQYRPEEKRSFDDMQDEIRRDLVEQDLEQHTKELLGQIIDQAQINMGSWSKLINQRRQDAQIDGTSEPAAQQLTE